MPINRLKQIGLTLALDLEEPRPGDLVLIFVGGGSYFPQHKISAIYIAQRCNCLKCVLNLKICIRLNLFQTNSL